AQFTFWRAVKSVQVEGGSPDAVGSVRRVTYTDGAVEELRIVELSDLSHSLSYEVFASTPPSRAAAALHSVRLIPVTHDGSTLVELAAEFAAPGEWTAAVVQDAAFKKKEMLEI
ncbi:hypothetical protein HK405_000250, partial [Cladochytrium tenue]